MTASIVSNGIIGAGVTIALDGDRNIITQVDGTDDTSFTANGQTGTLTYMSEVNYGS